MRKNSVSLANENSNNLPMMNSTSSVGLGLANLAI